MVADAVESLGAEVQFGQRNVGSPGAVVEAVRQEGVERLLRCVTARPVTAVVAQRDRISQCDVRPDRPGDGRRHLGHLECMRQPGALVVGGVDHHLRLACEAPEGSGVHDPIPVALETGSLRIGRLGYCPLPCANGKRGAWTKSHRLALFANLASHGVACRDADVAVVMGHHHVFAVTVHSGRPTDRAGIESRDVRTHGASVPHGSHRARAARR